MNQPRSRFGMRLLPFRLHHFRRITWTSQRARGHWEPRLKQIRDALRQPDYAILDAGVYSSRLDRVYYHEVAELQRAAARFDLHTVRLDYSAEHMSRFFPARFEADERRAFVIQGRPDAVQAACESVAKYDFAGFHSALGVPDCCIQFLRAVIDAEITDPTWPAAVSSQSERESFSITLDSCWQTNTLLDPIGIRCIAHWPCQVNCSRSIGMADAIAATRERPEYGRLTEILAWPTAWSALHGIAEVKTPVFKLIYDTDATAHKHELKRLGSVTPAEGAQGLEFPYRPPERLSFTDSPAFRRGLEHPLVKFGDS